MISEMSSDKSFNGDLQTMRDYLRYVHGSSSRPAGGRALSLALHRRDGRGPVYALVLLNS